MLLSELHRAARELAEGGVPVFPCAPLSKKPASPNGFHDATTKLEVIDAWWTENPDYNPAFCPHLVGLGVVDIDGDDGERNWLDWQTANGFAPATREIRTPRGGRHLYFLGALPASQSKIAPHIDTRGVGSYVLAPPSRVRYPDGSEGSYTVLAERAPAELPVGINDFLVAQRRDAAKAAIDDLDLPQNIARAERLLRDYVARGHIAIEGQMGDGRTYAVACEVLNMGVSPERAMDLLTDIWNPHCQPPWDEDELRGKVENASRYAQNEAGAWAVEPAEVVFADALDKLVDETPAPAPSSRFRLWTLEEMNGRPPPVFLIPEMFPAGGISVVYGPPSSYKSFWTLERALELASLGHEVVYIGGEGGRGLGIRANAWKQHKGIEDAIPLYLVENMPWANDGGMIVEFMENVKKAGIKPSLVVIDTAARMLVGLNENDAKDMGLFVAAVDTIKRALNTAVAIVHHTGKEGARGARGSNALEGGVDAMFEVKADKATKALAVWCRRQKDAPEREKPWTYEGKEFAGSLVFEPLDLSAYFAMTKVDELLSGKKIGALLRALGAVGEENAVSSYVLAQELNPPDPAVSEEGRQAVISRTLRVLAKKATGPLEAYCQASGRDLLWFVP